MLSIILIVFMALDISLAREEEGSFRREPTTDNVIGQHPSSSMQIPTTFMTQELAELRNAEVRKWSLALMGSQFTWYKIGNVSEALGQACQLITPVLSGCSAGFKNPDLAIAAMCTGVVGIAVARFSHYAHRESAERGDAVNRFLANEHVRPIVVIKDSSTEGGDSR